MFRDKSPRIMSDVEVRNHNKSVAELIFHLGIHEIKNHIQDLREKEEEEDSSG